MAKQKDLGKSGRHNVRPRFGKSQQRERKVPAYQREKVSVKVKGQTGGYNPDS